MNGRVLAPKLQQQHPLAEMVTQPLTPKRKKTVLFRDTDAQTTEISVGRQGHQDFMIHRATSKSGVQRRILLLVFPLLRISFGRRQLRGKIQQLTVASHTRCRYLHDFLKSNQNNLGGRCPQIHPTLDILDSRHAASWPWFTHRSVPLVEHCFKCKKE